MAGRLRRGGGDDNTGGMLKALSIADARAIEAAAAARARDERAMLDYVGVGRRAARRTVDLSPRPLLIVTDAAELASFDGGDERHLRDLIARLSGEARQELIALVWVASSVALGFEAALRRTRRIPPEAQIGYLASRRLERHIPAGLEKLAAAGGAA